MTAQPTDFSHLAALLEAHPTDLFLTAAGNVAVEYHLDGKLVNLVLTPNVLDAAVALLPPSNAKKQ